MKAVLCGLPVRLRGLAGVLVDTNVLLDIATRDQSWVDWSRAALAECAEQAPMVIDPIVYAEVSVNYATVETLDAVFPASLYHRQALPWEASRRKVLSRLPPPRRTAHHRSAGFLHRSPCGDFPAYAVNAGHRRYRTYFPMVEILAP